MKISFCSDIHLEFHNTLKFSKEDKEGGDLLIIAGDLLPAALIKVGRTDPEARKTKKFLKNSLKPILSNYTHVVYVMGNHEHYMSNFSETKKDLIDSFKDLELSIQILDNDRIILDSWTIIGSTLWTNYDNANPIIMNIIGNGMNDYRCIGSESGPFSRYITRGITPQFLLQEYDKSIQYIEQIAKTASNVIVVTHTAPSQESVNKQHTGDSLNFGYYSELSEFIYNLPQIKYWIHGHTHQSVDYKIHQCNVLSNQRGYPGEASFSSYKGFKHIEV